MNIQKDREKSKQKEENNVKTSHEQIRNQWAKADYFMDTA